MSVGATIIVIIAIVIYFIYKCINDWSGLSDYTRSWLYIPYNAVYVYGVLRALYGSNKIMDRLYRLMALYGLVCVSGY